MKPRKCYGCSAMIYDLKNERTGRTAPIDVDPVPDGNITIDLEKGTYRVGGWTLGQTPRHKNHFATCPASARFKRPLASRSR